MPGAAIQIITPEPASLQNTGLEATGQGGRTAVAVQHQRTADTIRSVLSLESVGRFPDPATAAFQRIPGINTYRYQVESRWAASPGR